MTTSALFGIPYLSPQQSQPEVTINKMVDLVELFVAPCISVHTVNTPPGSPSEGDAYVIGTSPTGAWAGRASAKTKYTAGGWVFLPDVNSSGTVITIGADHIGLTAFNQVDELMYYWDGSDWVVLTDGSGA